MAKKIDPREMSLIPMDLALQVAEFKDGKPIGETARVPVMTEYFSWKRAFMNVWTGWPNDGKSTFFLFMALMKSLVDNWKWCIWSPEMYNAVLDDKGKLQTSASDLIDELVFMKEGLCPYLHFKRQYGIPQMSLERYIAACEWVKDHFVFIDPKERKYNSLLDNFRFWHDAYNFQGFLVDPFKNLDHSDDAGGRFDLYLDRLFTDTKRFTLETNSSFNFIAHPRNDKDPKNADGSYKICTQFALAGGAAWNNNMDGIFSTYRPWKHKNPADPRVQFFTLKQRKQQLVGRVGVYDKIEFAFDTNRYYFDGHCPIDGQYREPLAAKQEREVAKRKEEAAAGNAFKKAKITDQKTIEKIIESKNEHQLAGAVSIPFTEVAIEQDQDGPNDDKPIF